MRRFFKRDTAYVIANQVLLSIASALIVILLARYMSQAEFGEIRYVIALLTIFSFWSLPGISTVINQEVSVMTRNGLIRLIAAQLRWGLGALAAACAVAAFHMYQGNADLARAFIIGGALAPLANLYLVPGLVLAGMHKFKQKTRADGLIIAAAVIGAYFGVQFFTDIGAVIGAYLGAQALATLCGLYFVTHTLPDNGDAGRYVYTASVREGRQLTLLQIPFTLVYAIEKAVVFFILGPVALAVFVIAVLPVEHFKGAFRNLMQFYMLPHLTKENPNTLLHWFATGSFILTLGIIGLILFILFGMPLLFADFADSKPFALLLVLAVLPLPIHVITINWIAQRNIRTLGIYAAFAVVANVISVASAAFLFGLWGAVVAKIVYEVLLAAGLLQLDRKARRL